MSKLEIDGITYFSTTDLLTELGVSRQTLWRWRRHGKIPSGHRYRDKTILFTADEVELIRQYANRIEPTGKANKQPRLRQLGLFNGLVNPSRSNTASALNPEQDAKQGLSDIEPNPS
jgi:hypothetical protein